MSGAAAAAAGLLEAALGAAAAMPLAGGEDHRRVHLVQVYVHSLSTDFVWAIQRRPCTRFVPFFRWIVTRCVKFFPIAVAGW